MRGDSIRFIRFFAAFTVTVTLILLTVTGFFLFSAVSGQNGTDGTEDDGIRREASCSAKMLAIFDGGDRVYACTVTVNNGVSAEPVGRGGIVDGELLTVYRRDGSFALADAVGIPRYIKFTPETFEKFADIFHGVVYNDNGTKRLMTGGQAANAVDRSTFPDFCAFVTGYFYPGRAADFVLAVTGLCDNNLSYPELYGAFGQEG